MRRSLFAVAFVSLAACANQAVVTRATDNAQLSTKDADRIIQAYEERHTLRVDPNEPLHNPKSLDDLEQILKRDEISLFPDGVRWAVANPSPKADVLRAQTLLAWGEAQENLAKLLDRATSEMRHELQELEHKGTVRVLTDGERRQREQLAGQLNDLAGIHDALLRRAADHLAEGAKVAEALIAAKPDDYRGYRIAADYYRLREDWAKFDLMMAELDRLHPQSNGALFLRGMEALERDKDFGKAKKAFKDALSKDPQFTRAQVQLLLAEPDISAAWDEFKKLRQMSPRHQIVQWAGPAIEAQFTSWKANQDRVRQRDQDRALSVPAAQQ